MDELKLIEIYRKLELTSCKMSRYGMTLFGSTPQLALITTFGSACSILVLNSLDAKPIKKWNYLHITHVLRH